LNAKAADRKRRASSGQDGLLDILAILGAALALRLTYLWETLQSPFAASLYLPIDARRYHIWAIDWLHGAWPTHEAFFRPPLYPFFLGSIYSLSGPNPVAALLVQAVLGAASCLLVHGIARELFADRRVALLASFVCAAYGTLIYFDAQLLSGSLDVFLQLLVLRLLLVASRRPGLGWWLATGACIGLSATNRGAVLLLMPFLLVWLWRLPAWRPGAAAEPPRRRQRHLLPARALALLLPVGLAILPVTWHNVRYDKGSAPQAGAQLLRRVAAGDFVALASNSGINFYLGNHRVLRAANRLDHPDHFAVYDRVRNEPASKGLTSASAANAYLVRETLRHVSEWPREWLVLMGIKLVELVNGTEIPRNTSLYADRQYSSVLSALLWKRLIAFPSGLVIPFGLVGIWLARRAWRKHFLVWSSLTVQAVFILAFFVTARYRLPMLPLLGIYAAHAGLRLFDRLQAGERAAAARLGCALAALLVVSNLGIVPVSESHHAIDHYDRGIAYEQQGEHEKAEVHMRRAVELSPHNAEALVHLCDLLLNREQAEEALPFCSRAVQADPMSAPAHYRLGLALERLGRSAESVTHYEQATRLAPDASAARRALERVRGAL
jgi:tetratricopeptide (TPR) repeat protein